MRNSTQIGAATPILVKPRRPISCVYLLRVWAQGGGLALLGGSLS